MPDDLLQTAGLAKDYGDGHGIHGLDLAVGPGELVMLVGPNGAGKSTFLGCVSGLVEPTGGEVTVAGHAAGSLAARALTSWIPDNPVLYDDLSVWEHLAYIAGLYGTEDWESYAEDLLDLFSLTERAEDLPVRFSRGLRQKAALCCGLIRPFRLLLVDEPFVGLDVPGQETLTEVLADLVADGATVVCSTHQLGLVPTATRCIGLRDGLVAHDGEVSEDVIRELVG